MSSLKTNDAFNGFDLQSNIIVSQIISNYLKGESYIPFEKFRDIGMSEDAISSSLMELRDSGLLHVGSGDPLTWQVIDSSICAGINILGFSMKANFATNNQPSLPTNGKAPQFDEGTQDHRVGFAVYRCKVAKGELEEGEPVDYRVNIDRYTIHPDHRQEENPQTFSTVRNLIVDSPVPSAEAGWKYWDDFIAKRTELTDGETAIDSIIIDDVKYGLVTTESESEEETLLAQVLKIQDGTELLVSEIVVENPDDEFTFWETSLDDLYPGTALASPSLTVESNEEDAVELLAKEVKFNLDINGAFIECFFVKGISEDHVTFAVEDGKKPRKLTIKKDRPTSVPQLKLQVQTWLEGVIS